jgi:hypothetical protein
MLWINASEIEEAEEGSRYAFLAAGGFWAKYSGSAVARFRSAASASAQFSVWAAAWACAVVMNALLAAMAVDIVHRSAVSP